MTSKTPRVDPRYAVPAVDQMLDMVEHLADSERSHTLSDLSKTLGITLNTAFRILRRLTARGYAEIDAATGGYRLSTRFFTLGMRLHARFDLRRRARPHLELFSQETSETTQLYILQDDHALVLDCIPPPASAFIHVVPGSPMRAHASAFSKAILAFLPEAEVRRRLPKHLDRLTPNTITDRDALSRDLARIRETGLSYDREEYTIGIYCIGAPLFGADGEVVAGAGVTGLVSRFHPENLAAFEEKTLACAERVSRDIGYVGDRFEAFRQVRRRASEKASGPSVHPKYDTRLSRRLATSHE
jgi:DNA-binding IclR family transcriptional regulator